MRVGVAERGDLLCERRRGWVYSGGGSSDGNANLAGCRGGTGADGEGDAVDPGPISIAHRYDSGKISMGGIEGSYPSRGRGRRETPRLRVSTKRKKMRANAACSSRFRSPTWSSRSPRPSRSLGSLVVRAKKVEIEALDGTVHEVQVEEGETILEAALDAGVDAPHDCKMGVCMTCPSRLVSGKVDQSAGMLSEDVIDQGYALLCVSTPDTDCRVKIIEEEELLNVQLVAGEM